jgi:hypothetical protein
MRGLVVLLVLVASLSGCTGGTEAPPASCDQCDAPIPPGKGAIAGLVIDDRYRPIPAAQLILFPLGIQATADAVGQFLFSDLEPGAYELRAAAKDHEAAPMAVDVEAGAYTEVELAARRVFSEGGRIVTTQYSVFVPCSHSDVQSTTVRDCTFDGSGDSYRPGFVSDYLRYGKNVTWLVTEMRSNHKASASQGAYKVVVREEGNGDYWGSKFITDTDYLKITLHYGNVSADDTEAGRNKPWMNDKTMETVLFPQGGMKQETQGVLDTECQLTGGLDGCYESRGLGVQMGVKGNFVQSLFIGPPEVDVATYGVLAE